MLSAGDRTATWVVTAREAAGSREPGGAEGRRESGDNVTQPGVHTSGASGVQRTHFRGWRTGTGAAGEESSDLCHQPAPNEISVLGARSRLCSCEWECSALRK